MNTRLLFCAAAIAACAAYAGTHAMSSAQAAEVKEHWLIDEPNPNDPATQKAAAATAAAASAKPSATGADHGLTEVKNPDTGNPAMIAEGKELFVSMACSGCHGAGGGGGMCPAVINDIWVYGSDDTTLFNLVKLGSAGLQAKGFTRIGHENVVGEMPPFAAIVTDEQLWKLIAYVRSKYAGDPALKNW